MLTLNETIIIDPEIEVEWLTWVRSNYIPAVMATGYFTAHRMLTVLNSPNEGITYCLQFDAPDVDSYRNYQQNDIVHIRNKHHQQFENRFVLFETIMQLVN